MLQGVGSKIIHVFKLLYDILMYFLAGTSPFLLFLGLIFFFFFKKSRKEIQFFPRMSNRSLLVLVFLFSALWLIVTLVFVVCSKNESLSILLTKKFSQPKYENVIDKKWRRINWSNRSLTPIDGFMPPKPLEHQIRKFTKRNIRVITVFHSTRTTGCTGTRLTMENGSRYM